MTTLNTNDQNNLRKEILGLIGIQDAGYINGVDVTMVYTGTYYRNRKISGIQFRAPEYRIPGPRGRYKNKYAMRRVMIKDGQIDKQQLEKAYNEIADIRVAFDKADKKAEAAEHVRSDTEKSVRTHFGLSEYCSAIKTSDCKNFKLEISGLTLEQLTKFMNLAKAEGIKVGY